MGVLYRKLIIWMDLNIQSDDFEHIKIVEAISLIQDLKEEYKQAPTKLFFREVDLETSGWYSVSGQADASSSDAVQNLEALCQSFFSMENLIKKNFKLSQEKLVAFIDQNPVQITLREELEAVYKAKNQLEEENNNFKMSMMSNRDGDSNNL